MKNVLIIGILILLIGASVVSSVQINTTPQPSSRGTWLYVGGSEPGNYTTIQSAIDDANPGDTVFVYNGTYFENVMVNKIINLFGENRDSTIIDGRKIGDVIYVSSSDVAIFGFTVQNSGSYPHSGIQLCHCNNITVISTIISNNTYGIYLVYSSGNTLYGNTAYNNEQGIKLDHSNNNIIMSNTASNNDVGILLGYSSNNNTIKNNDASNNLAGIILAYSSDNTITGNTASNNTDGIILGCSSDNTIIGNTASNNGYYGVALYSSSNNNAVYHNNLQNNTQNAYDDGNNTWDNGYPSGGNYWSDYTGTDDDGDGIGDIPYNIPGGGNQDLYPLMQPWSGNRPPHTPTITGPAQGKIRVVIAYNFTAIDPDDDCIFFYIDWGDETTYGWIGPYSSGEMITLSHTWAKKGDYVIKAKAKDSNGAESDWGILSITIPYSYDLPFMQFWIRLFERFPNAFPLLRHLMGYEPPSFYHLFAQKKQKQNLYS